MRELSIPVNRLGLTKTVYMINKFLCPIYTEGKRFKEDEDKNSSWRKVVAWRVSTRPRSSLRCLMLSWFRWAIRLKGRITRLSLVLSANLTEFQSMRLGGSMKRFFGLFEARGIDIRNED